MGTSETLSLLEQLHAMALREDWARDRVRAAGKSWLDDWVVKFDGTVVER